MKRLLIVTLMLAAVVVTTGCANTTTSLQPDDQLQELYRLRAENARLRATGPEGGDGAQAPMPIAGPMMQGGGYGPPQGVAMAYREVDGCEGVLKVRFHNWSKYHVQIYLDSEELSVNDGQGGVFETIPPRTDVYVCLDAPGTHQVSGIVYTLRYGAWVKIDEFDTPQTWGFPPSNGSMNVFTLNESLFRNW